MLSGTMLGPYRIEAKLGEGGMGEVYKTRDTRLDRTVAIKVLPAELSADPERRARFEREARGVAALSHPHSCTLHDVGEGVLPNPESRTPNPEPAHHLVMEHLGGESLADRLKRGPLPLAQALDIAAQIADALDAAHKHGIVHRDLRPGRVMLTPPALDRVVRKRLAKHPDDRRDTGHGVADELRWIAQASAASSVATIQAAGRARTCRTHTGPALCPVQEACGLGSGGQPRRPGARRPTGRAGPLTGSSTRAHPRARRPLHRQLGAEDVPP